MFWDKSELGQVCGVSVVWEQKCVSSSSVPQQWADAVM